MYSTEKYPSKILQEAVEAIGSLPGVGSRSALRLALHLLGQPADHIHHFTEAVNRLADDVHYCHICQMIADADTCSICADRSRDARTICVVESVRDVMSIEATGQYRGVYHVLGGIIRPSTASVLRTSRSRSWLSASSGCTRRTLPRRTCPAGTA